MIKEKKVGWQDDVLVKVSRDTRAKLKMKALLTDKGLTIKELLSRFANEKSNVIKN